MIPERIKLARIYLKLTQQQLADQLGINKRMLDEAENEENEFTFDIAIHLSKTYNIYIGYFKGIDKYTAKLCDIVIEILKLKVERNDDDLCTHTAKSYFEQLNKAKTKIQLAKCKEDYRVVCLQFLDCLIDDNGNSKLEPIFPNAKPTGLSINEHILKNMLENPPVLH